MDKQVLNKGYTTIELMIVLFLICLFTLLTISINRIKDNNKDIISSSYRYISTKSLYEKEYNFINISNNVLYIDDESISKVNCNDISSYYNEYSNINQANTITCYNYDLTLSLGIGSIYEK